MIQNIVNPALFGNFAHPLLSQTAQGVGFVAVFFLSALFGPLVVHLLKARGVVATPAAGSVRKTPVPTGAGWLFVLFFVPIAFVCQLYYPLWDINLFMYSFITLSLLVAIVGFVDDTSGLNGFFKVLMHVVAVGVALYWLPPLAPSFGVDVPLWVEKLVLGAGWVWFINLFNFMDGTDGIAAVEGFFICMFFALLLPEIKYIALVLAAALMGFLRINTPPARAFMGDTGSTFLGYVLGGFIILSLYFWGGYALWPVLTLALFFLVDTGYTCVSRLVRLKNPLARHGEHWYQRALYAGMNHKHVLRWVVGINIALFALAMGAYNTNMGFEAPALGFVMLVMVGMRVRRLEKRHRRKAKA